MYRCAMAIRAGIGAAGEHPIWEEKVQAGTAGYRPATNQDDGDSLGWAGATPQLIQQAVGAVRAGTVISDLLG